MPARSLIIAALGGALFVAPPTAKAGSDYAVAFNNTRNDGGFNESAVRGLERFSRETGEIPREIIVRTGDDSIRAIRGFAEHGVRNILLIGFVNEPALREVAPGFPGTRFTIIDGAVDLPNVRSVLFREEEAGYLVGVAAGLATRSGRVGFIGGMPIPPIRRFGCGFVHGVASANPAATVLRSWLGTDPDVFRNRTLAMRQAQDMLTAGADVLFPAAGFAGTGVLQAAATAGRLGIGVDTNQNGLFPGHVLTSAIKRVDVAAYATFSDAHAGRWTGGVVHLGVADQGIAWAHDTDNDALVRGIAGRIDAAANGLAAGTIHPIPDPPEPDCP